MVEYDVYGHTENSNNRTTLRFRSCRLFLPVTPLDVSLTLPTYMLKFPNRPMESPDGAQPHPMNPRRLKPQCISVNDSQVKTQTLRIALAPNPVSSWL